MKNKLQRIKKYVRVNGEKGQGLILGIIEIALAIYILIILIKYLIIPALFGD